MYISGKRITADDCCCLNSNLLIQWFFPTFRSASICMQNFLIQTNRWVIHCENSSNCCWSRRFLVSKSLATIICYEIRWLPHTKMVSVSNQKICEIDIRIFFTIIFEMREKNSGLVFVVHLRENCEKNLTLTWYFNYCWRKIPRLYYIS